MPARRFLDAGVHLAIAADYNPGTAPSYHLPLAMLLACVHQSITAAKALRGATVEAARAIGLEQTIGSPEAGKAADFVLLSAPSIEDWIYSFDVYPVLATYIGGEPIFDRRVESDRAGDWR